MRALALLALIGADSGCDMRKIDDQNAAQFANQFQNGTLELSSGSGTFSNTAYFSNQYNDMVRRRQWPELAKLLIEADEASDLSWFLLAISANELGYRPAARVYIANSVDASHTYCARGAQYVADVCYGLILPDDAIVYLGKLNKSVPGARPLYACSSPRQRHCTTGSRPGSPKAY